LPCEGKPKKSCVRGKECWIEEGEKKWRQKLERANSRGKNDSWIAGARNEDKEKRVSRRREWGEKRATAGLMDKQVPLSLHKLGKKRSKGSGRNAKKGIEEIQQRNHGASTIRTPITSASKGKVKYEGKMDVETEGLENRLAA